MVRRVVTGYPFFSHRAWPIQAAVEDACRIVRNAEAASNIGGVLALAGECGMTRRPSLEPLLSKANEIRQRQLHHPCKPDFMSPQRWPANESKATLLRRFRRPLGNKDWDRASAVRFSLHQRRNNGNSKSCVQGIFSPKRLLPQ